MLGRRDSTVERVARVFLDLLAFFISANLAFDLRYLVDWGPLQPYLKGGPAPWGALYQALPYLLLGWFIIFSIYGLYGPFFGRRKELAQIAKAVITAFVVMFAAQFFIRGFSFSRVAALLLIPVSFCFTALFRAGR